MQYHRDDPGYQRIATLDIETTHYDAAKGELVSIGVGVHERGSPGESATYDTFHREGSGEVPLVGRAMEQLETYGADGLVSYNGLRFDLSFIEERLENLDEPIQFPEIVTSTDTHLDLFLDRMDRANNLNLEWPSLEQCLESYNIPKSRTVWNDHEITNALFGRKLGPEYLRAVMDDPEYASSLLDIINHYLVTDLEANIALFYADVGEEFDYNWLGSKRSF